MAGKMLQQVQVPRKCRDVNLFGVGAQIYWTAVLPQVFKILSTASYFLIQQVIFVLVLESFLFLVSAE